MLSSKKPGGCVSAAPGCRRPRELIRCSSDGSLIPANENVRMCSVVPLSGEFRHRADLSPSAKIR
jgi:hypothetical protein